MRKLPAELVTLIDQQIPLAHEEICSVIPSELFIMALSATLGITESGGNNRGKWVEEIQSVVSKPLAQPWCMDEVQMAVGYVELKLGIKSPIYAGEHCQTVYSTSDCKLPPGVPISKGDVIIFQHGDTSNGHAASVLQVFEDKFAWCIEANTSPGLGMNRDGDGVYCRMRSLRHPIGDMKIFGVLRPFP